MKKHRGFTLVELMVALVLGLIVIAGAIQLFVTTKSTFNNVESISMRQEALRYVSDVVSRDIRNSPLVYVGAVEGNDLYIRHIPPYESHPYCNSSVDRYLHLIRYFHDGSDGLRLQYWCSPLRNDSLGFVVEVGGDLNLVDLVAPTNSVGGEIVQDNIESIRFAFRGTDYPHLSGVSINSLKFQVETRLTLSEDLWRGAGEEKRTYVFNTARRNEIIDRLELVPEFGED